MYMYGLHNIRNTAVRTIIDIFPSRRTARACHPVRSGTTSTQASIVYGSTRLAVYLYTVGMRMYADGAPGNPPIATSGLHEDTEGRRGAIRMCQQDRGRSGRRAFM